MKLSAADERCEPCDGRGYWRDEFKKKRTCSKCGGTGKVKKAADGGPGWTCIAPLAGYLSRGQNVECGYVNSNRSTRCEECGTPREESKTAASKWATTADPAAAVEALTALLAKITKGGGIHGNPYTVPEVHAGFQALGLDKFGDPLPESGKSSSALSQFDKRAEPGEPLRTVKILEEPEHEFGIAEFSDGTRAVWNSATSDAWHLDGTTPTLIMAGGRASGPDELQKYVDAIELGFDGSAEPLPEDEIEFVKGIAWS